MAEKKRGKKRKEEFPEKEEKVEKPSKDEYSVAKWLRDNVPSKKTKFLGHNVQYFTGTKAVDALMQSKWGKTENENEEPFFASRDHCIDFLDMMLRHKFFHRAKKVLQEKLTDFEKKKKKIKDKKSEEKDKKEKKEEVEKKEKKSDDKKADEDSHTEGKKTENENEEEKKGKKKKVKLDMHRDQIFVDSLDAYVWIYDPIPVYYPLIGSLVVLAAIIICLFPLWPSSVRSIVYYLSVAAACFLVFIIALALIRSVLFFIIWLLSGGKHHLWILPNLTEDVGFFASFWPLYQYKYKGNDGKSSKSKKSKKKYKDSDEEDENTVDDNEEDSKDRDMEESMNEQEGEADVVAEQEEENITAREETGSDSEGSSQSQTGKDFEMVDKSELTQQEQVQ